MLLPPDLRDWVPEDDMVHFVIEAVERIPLSENDFVVNRRGTGSAQYHPKMMLALLIYCYANGIFSSRKIERATYVNVSVRYLTADTHPDHDTICAFRRRNFDAFAKAFLHVLELATEMGVLKVGTISVDGTQIDANASKSKNVRHDRAEQLEKMLRADIDELMKKAEAADGDDSDDGGSLPEEIARRERLLEKMERAQANLRKRADQRHAAELAEFERKTERYQERQRKGRRGARKPQEPVNKGPKPTDQSNLTDDDSRLMRKNRRAEFRQAYNAQTAVDVEGSQLVLSAHVSNCASDAGELEPAIEGIDPSLGRPGAALVDSGYQNVEAIERVQASGVEVYISTGAEDGNNDRRYDFRPPKKRKSRGTKDKRIRAMQEKMKTEEARRLYRLRKQTVEPVFGIVKSVMGFHRFLLRGLEKATTEWRLVMLAYNVKRLYALRGAIEG